MIKHISILFMAFAFTLCGCTITPKPLTVDERYALAQADVKAIFAEQSDKPRHIDFYEALARSLKYNLDYRIKLVNTALQAGQLRVAEWTMFPNLNASGSVYTRNNDLASFGITSAGNPTDVLNSTPRTLRTARLGLSWNILDFGLGYVRAKQQGERILIAQEESRKQAQALTQDVLVAYWSAYNAQELMVQTKEFQRLLISAKNKLLVAMRDRIVPKENILNYQAALLEGDRRLVQLQYKYDKALSDLRRLLNLPLDIKLSLAPPPEALRRPQNLHRLEFEKLDAVTLVNRPELRGQEYQKRIANLGVKVALLQALPGITLNAGWNYNSNKFLINNKWVDRSVDVAWNLLNLASLPDSYDTAKVQVKYEHLKEMALTIGVLTETRYAYWHYKTLSDEYAIAHKQTLNSDAIYRLNRDRRLASIASDQQVILAKLRAITSKMDEDLLLSDLSTALGELYLSSGSDILPLTIDTNQSIPRLAMALKEKFLLQNTLDFTTHIDNMYHQMFGDKIMVAKNKKAVTVITTTAPNTVTRVTTGPNHYQTECNANSTRRPAACPRDPELKSTIHTNPLLALKGFFNSFKKNTQPTKPTPLARVAETKSKPKTNFLSGVFTKLFSHQTAVTIADNNKKASYTVQISSGDNLENLMKMSNDLKVKEPSHVALTQKNGDDWYVLTIGRYNSMQEAKTSLQHIQGELKNNGSDKSKTPWIRTTDQLSFIM